MPSPTTASQRSDDVSALLMGHHQQCPTSSDVSIAYETFVETFRKESGKPEAINIIPKHGFVLESSSVVGVGMNSKLPSHGTSIFDTNTSILSFKPNSPTETTSKMELDVQPPIVPLLQRRPRSGSEGLDCLAFLAEQERHNLNVPTITANFVPGSSTGSGTVRGVTRQDPTHYTSKHPLNDVYSVVTPPTSLDNIPHTSSSSSSSSDTDDSEAMPPPQPRRPRSISNPDYMMNTEYQPIADHSVALTFPLGTKQERHFVLPPHLLRDELAKARHAVVRKAAAEISMTPYRYYRYDTATNERSSFRASPTIPEHAVYLQSNSDRFDYYKFAAAGVEEEYEDNDERPESGDEYDDDEDDDDDHEEVDIADVLKDQDITGRSSANAEMPMDTSISSMELLRRARSRLLEDLLSETNALNGTNDKTITVLPHTLTKYKMVRYTFRNVLIIGSHASWSTNLILLFFLNIIDLQSKWTCWYIYTTRTSRDYRTIPRQARTSELEQEDTVQLS